MTGLVRPSAAPLARAVLLAAVLAVAGCGSSPPATGSASVESGSLPPPLVGTPRSVGSSEAATSGAGQPASPAASTQSGSPSASVEIARIDPSLLGVLPAEIHGNRVSESTEGESSTVTDPAIARAVDRLAVGFVADSGGQNWAVATVSALRAGQWSDAFFRDWRDTYDAGACSQSGGVAGHAQSTIGSTAVWIGTCANGLRTYHAHVVGGDLLISISALGDKRFGEQLMAGLDVGPGASTTP